MKKQRFLRLTAVLALGLGLALALLWGLGTHPHLALANPGDLFVTMDGTGTACTQGTPCPLQTALDQATAGETIYVAQGIYTGTGSAVVTVTKSITLCGGWDGAPAGDVVRDPETYPTTLHGENQRRVVYVSGDITPALDGFIVTRGNATGLGGTPYDQDAGGGIYSEDASPIIVSNIITNNLASLSAATYARGGGIHLTDASATALISGNLIISNTASRLEAGLGGGISLNQSDATIQGNQVLSNTGSTSTWSPGGGMYIKLGNPTIVENAIQGNIASTVSGGSGGGIRVEHSSALVEGNLIANNQAVPGNSGEGGGVFVFLGAPTLNGNQVFSNAAQSGGGIHVFRSSFLTLTNNIVAQNAAEGLWFEGLVGSPVAGTLANNTIAQNDGAGVLLKQYASVTMTNNIIASNARGIWIAAVTTATVDHTLFFSNTSGDIGDSGSISSTHEITGSAPRFVDPAGWDYHVLPGSPAIDAGLTVPWLTTDIDGDARPWPTGGDYDVGADESTFVIEIVKSGPTWANESESIVYTLRVTNTGVITAESVVLTDSLPAGAGFVSASDGGGLESSNVATWPTFTVAPNGGAVARTFTVTATETITNDDYVAAPQGMPGVRGTVVVSTYVNHAPVAAADAMPDSLHSGTVTLDGSTSFDPDGHSLSYRWRQTGGPAEVALSGADITTATFDAPSVGGVYIFTLIVTDTFGASDADDTTVTVNLPGLSIVKAGPAEAEAEEPIVYTLTVTNTGSVAASSLVITDALPVGARLVNAGGGVQVGDVISWSVSSLAATGSLRRSFTVSATETITNADYRVSCAEGVSALGSVAVVTEVSGEREVYLPLVLCNR